MKNRYARVAITDVILGALIVLLYSPGLLGLSPADPSILRAGLAIIFGIGIAVTFAYTNIKALLPPAQPKLLVSAAEADADEVSDVLSEYAYSDVVGEIAAQGRDQLETLAKKKEQLMAMIDKKFEPSSISWTKFAGTVDAAERVVVKNAAELAERIHAFDVDDYENVYSLISSYRYKDDAIPDDIQEEKYALYRRNLEKMNRILEANERMLLKMDQFAMEMSSLEAGDNDSETSEIMEELEQLISDTKFYKVL